MSGVQIPDPPPLPHFAPEETMPLSPELDDKQVVALLDGLNQNLTHPWQIKSGKLYKFFKFKDFKEAFAFMTQVAEQSERLCHHPDWYNRYNSVEIYLTSHDVQALSQRDFDLAMAIEAIVQDYS